MSVNADSTASTAPRFGATIRSEWTKLWSVRSTATVLLLIAVVGVGISALASLGIADSYETLSAAQRESFDPVTSSMIGMNIALILFTVLGVLAATGEYASGMIRLSLTITPKRSRLLAAKVVALAAPAWVTGVVVAIASFVAGQTVLGRTAGVPTKEIGDDGVLASLISWGGVAAGFTLIALALGVLLRSAAGAIATALGIIFAPVVLGGILPDWITEHVLTYLPASAAEHITVFRPDPSAPAYLDPGVAQAVFGAWVAGLLVLASWTMSRRDVR